MVESGSTIVRRAVVWQLRPGSAAEYEREHLAIPTPLAEEISAQGIRNYSIYLHPDTDQLFAYFEFDASAAPPDGDGEEGKRWWEERMSRLLAANPDGYAVEYQLREVFHQD